VGMTQILSRMPPNAQQQTYGHQYVRERHDCEEDDESEELSSAYMSKNYSQGPHRG